MAGKYEATARGILDGVGGEDNVAQMNHCATRLRLRIKDMDQIDKAKVEATKGVITTVEAGGQFQVVIGNDVPLVFQEIAAITKLGGEIEQINTLVAAHGEPAVLDALRRAVAFRRWRAADVVSILAAGNGVPSPRAAGEALILDLPVAPTRSLDAYRIGGTR